MALPSRIVVPTDFSESAGEALTTALSIAERLGASVELLYIWEPSGEIPIETCWQRSAPPLCLAPSARSPGARPC